MKTKQIKLSVPTAMGDITLGQYQKYLSVVEKNEGDENATDFLNMKMIEIFCDVELTDVVKIPLSEVTKVTELLIKAFEEKVNLIRHFKLLDVDMGFIPSLDKMSLGEYVDVERNINDWQEMHRAMAVLFRPVNFRQKERYTIAPYEPSDEVAELMKEMPLDVAMGAMVFFYDLGMELLKAIPNYIQNNLTEEQTLLLKQTLAQNGVGINQFMHSLEETFANLSKLQSYQSSSVSHT